MSEQQIPQEDQFGLKNILQLLEQPAKVQTISSNQQEMFVFLFFHK